MPRHKLPPKPLTEVSRPEQAAVAIAERLSGSTVAEMAEVSGLPSRTAYDLAKRIETRYAELEGVKPMLRETHEKRLSQRLEWIDAYLDQDTFFEKLKEAKLKDIGIYEAVLTDKLLLLRGQPNQIISMADHSKLDELGPKLLEELNRRQLKVTATETKTERTVELETTD
jgi:hypothetical protein